MFSFWFGLFVIFGEVSILYGHEWNYQNPEKWNKMFPKDCNGSRQSPIHISDASGLEKIRGSLKLSWKYYDKISDSITLTNNGHSIQLEHKWKSSQHVPYVKFYNRKYVFAQLHFHWGRNDTEGSEHKVNGESFPLEMHMVHFNRNYGSLNEALKHPDGLLVIVNFYRVSEWAESRGLKNILYAAKSLKKVKSVSKIQTFVLSDLEVVRIKSDWVVYHGSLTTPNCNEVVTWLISLRFHHLSRKQMEILRALDLDHGDDFNNRPIQPLNNRKVYLFQNDE